MLKRGLNATFVIIKTLKTLFLLNRCFVNGQFLVWISQYHFETGLAALLLILLRKVRLSSSDQSDAIWACPEILSE